MKRVLVLATGDTIALSERGIVPGKELIADLGLGAFGGFEFGGFDLGGGGLGGVEAEDVSAGPSWDLLPETMLEIARRARAAILERGFAGVVVTHGVDTLEETAFLTDLLAGPAADRGAIVFTGAVRSRAEPSPDGPRNLAAAIVAAADPALRGAGAVVCFDDELHAARWATMVDPTSAAAFSSAPFAPLGRVRHGAVELSLAPPRRPPAPLGEPESSVALVKTYPGIDAALLGAIVDAGARGIVLEGTGLGSVPVDLFATIHELTSWDIPVVVASRSRVPTGAAGPPDESGAALVAKLGAIGARGLAPAKARCALMVALGGGGVAAARRWFERL